MKLKSILTALSVSMVLGAYTSESIASQNLINTQNSTYIKMRKVQAVPNATGTTIGGKLTYSTFSRNTDMGYLVAQVVGAKGNIVEQQQFELEDRMDGDNSRFGSFSFDLKTPISEITKIKIEHKSG